jgi:hypothetical protein
LSAEEQDLRSGIIVAAVVAGLAALGGFAFARLGGTLAQLQAIDVPVATSSPSGAAARDALPARDAAQPSSSTSPSPQRDVPEGVAADGEDAEISGDAHITQALAADPEFMRSAEELLNDPDPQVRLEARQLLRDLGAAVPAASDER